MVGAVACKVQFARVVSIHVLCMFSCGSQVFNLVFFRNKVMKPWSQVFKGELCKILETAKGGTPQGQQRVKIFSFILCWLLTRAPDT